MLSCLVMVPVTDPLLTNGITKAVVCAILSSDGACNRPLVVAAGFLSHYL